MTVELVGRDAELRRLDAFAASLTGGGTALSIVAGPGAGKTALWRSAGEHAEAAGVRVLRTRCSEVELPIALGAVSDLVGDAFGEIGRALPPAQQAALEVALGLESSDEVRPDWLALARSLLGVLRLLAGDSPVLVAVDDAQWLDPASRRVLSFALRRAGSNPVGLLATVRESAQTPDLLGLADAYEPGRFSVLSLGPMSSGSLQRLLRLRLGAHLPRPTLARVHAASGGNPMFALEFARLGVGSPAEQAAPLAIPASLEELVEARVAALPAELLPLLRVASALERPTIPVLEAALEPASDVERLVDEAQRAEALAVSPEGDLRFTHPLLAAAVYFGISPPERRGLHARLATIVPGVEERGRHAALAAEQPDATTARAVRGAAEAAAARGALDAAARLSAEAARLAPTADERREGELETATFLVDTGEFAAARERLEPLLAVPVPAPFRARALILRAECEIADRRRLVALLQEALELADAPLPRWQASIRLAQHGAWISGDAGRAVELARQALASALELDDPALISESEGAVAYYETACGLRTGSAEPTSASPPLLTLHVPWWHVGAGLSLGTRLMWSWELAEGRRVLEAEHAALSGAGREARAGFTLLTLGELEWRAGRLERSGALVTEATEILGDLILTAFPRLLLDTVRGRSDEAHRLGREMLGWAEALADRHHVPRVNWALGLLELSRGEPAAAYDLLAAAAAQLDAAGVVHPGCVPVLPDLVESLVGLGRLDEAEAAARPLDSATGDWARGVAARSRSLLLLARGESAAAARSAEEAAAALAAAGAPLDRGRALLAAGTAHLRSGERRLAAAAIESAAQVFEALGAPLWLERARRELRRARPRGRRDRDALTAAEERVAALVAAGRTNKEVAAELYTTVATVEAHLTRIYRKCSIRSRTELARLVADGSLTFDEAAE